MSLEYMNVPEEDRYYEHVCLVKQGTMMRQSRTSNFPARAISIISCSAYPDVAAASQLGEVCVSRHHGFERGTFRERKCISCGRFFCLDMQEIQGQADSSRNLGHSFRAWRQLLEEAKVQGVLSLSSTSRACGHRSVHLLCRRSLLAQSRACQCVFARW